MSAYQEVRRQIHSLTPDEQLRLLEELTAIVRHQGSTRTKRSIMELKGLGKEIWQGIDAQDFVNRERDTWNG